MASRWFLLHAIWAAHARRELRQGPGLSAALKPECWSSSVGFLKGETVWSKMMLLTLRVKGKGKAFISSLFHSFRQKHVELLRQQREWWKIVLDPIRFLGFHVIWLNVLACVSQIKIMHWIICSLAQANIHHEELAPHKLIQLRSMGSLLWKMILVLLKWNPVLS